MRSDIGADVQSYAQLIQQAGLVSVIASLAFGKNTFVRTEKKRRNHVRTHAHKKNQPKQPLLWSVKTMGARYIGNHIGID